LTVRQYVEAEPAPKPARPPVTPALVDKIARVTQSPVTQTLPVTVTQTLPVTHASGKKVGRPKSGNAMSAVERQRRRRDRLALAKADP
jgi:hypothetical protein